MNYYNEFDPNAAAWLRELMRRKLIPDGEVDERSIIDVRADDLRLFKQCHFFAGIGGWPLALRLAGIPDDFPLWTGSCPCQCFSNAGKQKGAKDSRDLWPVFFELVKACRPKFLFGEQVEAAIGHGWLDRVCANMETEGYAVGACVLGAHSVAAPHRRQRLYWGASRLADSPRIRGEQGQPYARRGNSGSGSEQGAVVECASGGVVSLAHSDGERCDGERIPNVEGEEAPQVAGGGLPSLPPYADYGLILCTDTDEDGRHKVRRVPAESLLFGVADGVPKGVDGSGNCGLFEDAAKGFPLSKKMPAHNMLIKGYGNAINPWCGKVFLEWFFEQEK